MRGTKRIYAALAAMLACHALPCAAADGEQNLAELFYRYANDNVIASYLDENTILASGQLEYKLYDGFLSLTQTDLDWDGAEELLAIRLKPQSSEGGEKQNTLVAEIYRRHENSLQRIAQYTLAEGILDQTNADVDVFALNGDSGQIICCEANDTERLLSDGVDWSLVAVGFDGSAFYEVTSVSLNGTFFEEEYMNAVYNAANMLGLEPYDPVWTPLADQLEGLNMLCFIDRYPLDFDGASNFLYDSGGEERFQYGETYFVGSANQSWENKLPKAFAYLPEEYNASTANNVGGQSAANGADGQSAMGNESADGQAAVANGQSAANGAVGQDAAANNVNGASDAAAQQANGGSSVQQSADNTFQFDGDYVIPDSDSRYLMESDFRRLSADEIYLARNEIYAKHGRIFNNAELNAYFRSKSWYQPTVAGSDFTEEYAASVFNEFETANIAAMIAYEKEHGFNDYD